MDVKHKLLLIFFLSAVDYGNGQNLSPDCDRDWSRYRGNRLTERWARRMSDSTGKRESGVLDGNWFYEGDYKECDRIRENETDPDAIRGLFCVARWTNSEIIPFDKGLGFCVPHTCTDADARVILDDVAPQLTMFQPPENGTESWCIRKRDLSQDAGAIVSITILSLFGAIVLAATVYDVFFVTKNSPKETDKPAVKNSKISPEEEETKLGTENYTNVDIKGKLKETDEKSTNGDVRYSNYIEYKKEDLPHTDNTNAANGYVQSDITEKREKASLENGKDNTAYEMSKSLPEINHVPAENGMGSLQVSGLDQAQHKQSKDNRHEYTTVKQSIPAQLLLAFSLNQNIPRLMRAKYTPGSFPCLNGIRFLAMAGVVWGHSYSFLMSTSSNQFPYYQAFLKNFMMEIFWRMWLVVDVFFLLSGFLVTYALMKTIKKHGDKVSLKMMVLYYFHRYWRLTPVYMICLMIYTTIMPYLMYGPLVVPEWTDDCKDIWWRNLLYIWNLWPTDGFQYCFGHAWYLAIDMQLYIIAPVFIVTTYFYPVIGIPLMLAGYGGSLISLIVILDQIYVRGSDKDAFIAVYMKPWTRATTYFMGMLLAVLLYKTNCRIKLHKLFVALGWFLSCSFIFLSMYVGWLQRCDADACTGWFTPEGVVAINALCPTMYCLGIGWIMFACICGYGGFVNSFLSWRGFIPLARLCYTMYLFHIMVMMIFQGNSVKQFYVTHLFINYTFCGHMVFTLACSFILTLVFEIPMMGLEKVLIPHR